MASPLSATTLPARLRAQLDAKLRAAGYGNVVATSAWLAEMGHPLSKSAIHRYSSRLRAVDAAAGRGVAPVLESRPASKKRDVSGNRRAEILEELRSLHARQGELLAELSAFPIPPIS